MKIKLYNDRDLKTKLPLDLLAEMENRDLLVADDKKTISFVGMILHEGAINVFLPRSIEEVSTVNTIKYAALAMNVVEKYSRVSKTKINDLDKGELIDGEMNLTLVKSIVTDFQQNGIYSRRQKATHLNSGKPDWKKTMNRFLPMTTKNKSPVYLDYFSKKNRNNSDNIVSQIHEEIIAYLDCNFSWWIMGSDKYRIAPELSYSKIVNVENATKLLILQQELTAVYSDRDVNLINNLIELLELTGGKTQSVLVAGLRGFHHAWEAMFREISEDVVDLNSKLPRPIYKNRIGENHKSSGMLTDIILEDENGKKLVIIDTKYYRAQNVENSPHWADIVKQFYYEKALSIIRPRYKILNYFVFPGLNRTFKSVHLVDQRNEVELDDHFAPIFCKYVDPIPVMEAYVDGRIIYSTDDFDD